MSPLPHRLVKMEGDVIAMQVLIYCRRETDLALLQEDSVRLCQYAIQQQHQISSVLLELDAGVFAKRLGIYEIRRQLQAGWAEGLLLQDYAVLALSEDVRRQILDMLQGYPILLAGLDSF